MTRANPNNFQASRSTAWQRNTFIDARAVTAWTFMYVQEYFNGKAMYHDHNRRVIVAPALALVCGVGAKKLGEDRAQEALYDISTKMFWQRRRYSDIIDTGHFTGFKSSDTNPLWRPKTVIDFAELILHEMQEYSLCEGESGPNNRDWQLIGSNYLDLQ